MSELKECPPNTYSFMCSKKCHCKNNVQCDDITGMCPRRECADGWTGDDCQCNFFNLVKITMPINKKIFKKKFCSEQGFYSDWS
jgi:hypothetical protein